MAGAGDGSTAGAMAAEVHGSTAGKHLYRRPPLQRVARSSARLRKRSGNSHRFSNRQKFWPSTLENPDAHLPCRSLSTIRISQKSEVSIAGDAHNPRNVLGSRGFQRLYESEKSPPDHSGVNDFCRNGHHDPCGRKNKPGAS